MGSRWGLPWPTTTIDRIEQLGDVEFTFEWYFTFVALGLTTDTADSFIEVIDSKDDDGIIFTNNPGLFKDVKNGKVINLFTYSPDLPNVFGIKLVVY